MVEVSRKGAKVQRRKETHTYTHTYKSLNFRAIAVTYSGELATNYNLTLPTHYTYHSQPSHHVNE